MAPADEIARRVLFIPRYEYLSRAAFLPVAQELATQGVITCLSTIDEPVDANWKEWPGPLLRGWPKRSGRGRLLDLWTDPTAVRSLLDEAAPDAVVVLSDLGGWRIRLAIREAERRNIPILMLLTVEIKPPRVRPDRVSRARTLAGALDGPLATAIFDAPVPGAFARHATIATTDQVIADLLIGRGVPAERIRITGDPGLDEDFPPSLMPPPLPTEVVYWTEVIQELYGEQYACDTFRHVANVALELGLKLMVRSHPREPSNMQDFYRDATRANVEVTRGDVTWRAAVHVAHFSTTITRAALLRRPTISLNFRSDEYCRIFPRPCEVTTPDELRSALAVAVASPGEWVARLDDWRRIRGAFVDGASASRVTRLITDMLRSAHRPIAVLP